MAVRERVQVSINGKRLEELRGPRTLRDVATAAGITESYLGHLELGRRVGCRLRTRLALAAALGVEVAEIEVRPPAETAA